MSNKHWITLLAAMAMAAMAMTRAADVWQDPSVNQVNREMRRANFFAFESEALALTGDKTASARYMSLEDKWRFHFVKNHDLAPKGFYTTQYDDSG